MSFTRVDSWDLITVLVPTIVRLTFVHTFVTGRKTATFVGSTTDELPLVTVCYSDRNLSFPHDSRRRVRHGVSTD